MPQMLSVLCGTHARAGARKDDDDDKVWFKVETLELVQHREGVPLASVWREPISNSDAVWKRSARKVALAPAVGPCSKSTAWPTMRIADGGFPDTSAVSLTTTVYWTSSSSSVSWWMEKLA